MHPTAPAITWITLSANSRALKRPARARWTLHFASVVLAVVGLTPQSTATPVFDRKFKKDLEPQVRITSPLDGAFIAPGDSRIGSGDPNGTGFAIVAEIRTRDNIGVTVDEGVNIRNADDLWRFRLSCG